MPPSINKTNLRNEFPTNPFEDSLNPLEKPASSLQAMFILFYRWIGKRTRSNASGLPTSFFFYC